MVVGTGFAWRTSLRFRSVRGASLLLITFTSAQLDTSPIWIDKIVMSTSDTTCPPPRRHQRQMSVVPLGVVSRPGS